MQHTLVAVFDNRNDAKQAMDELLASNFTSTNVRLSKGDTADASEVLGGGTVQPAVHNDDDSIASSIRNFFSDIFGTDDSVNAQRYETAVTRGHHVLTVGPVSEPEVERAADIVERFGPIDIDEENDGAEVGTVGADQIMRRDSPSIQAAQPLSFQNDDRAPFQQGNLNDAVPMGGTYQEPMGDNGNLGLTGGNLGNSVGNNAGNNVGSNLGNNAGASAANLGGQTMSSSTAGMSMQDGSHQGSMQRDDYRDVKAIATPTDIKRAGMRVFSRDAGDFGNPDAGSLQKHGMPGLGTNNQQQLEKDAEYLKHYNSNYANDGGKYDEYAPAYSYGSSLKSNDKYRGRSWDDAESDIRTDWESRNGGSTSTWEKMKSAVREGWDRMTS
jgi:hypothetical protein